MDLEKLEYQVNGVMNNVHHPVYKQGLTELGITGKLEQDGDQYRLTVKTPDDDRKTQITLESRIRRVIQDLIPGKLKIRFEVDESLKPEDAGNRLPGVKYIIAVFSGKGGVGKSTVAANLAAAIVNRGLKAGLMDADIYGPSIGKMFGKEGMVQLRSDGTSKVFPVEVHGLKLMSFSFLINPEQAVVWRGPMLGKAVEQFLYEILWGELDYLVIDLPPGTGDVQLSLAQLVDMDGAIVVTTPQSMALSDARRAVTMFEQVKVPVLGVVENMSEFICPHCGESTHIFSRDGAATLAARLNIPLLGSVPLMKEIMETGEDGIPFVLQHKNSPVAKAYDSMIDRLEEEIAKYR